jgi:hypothetical protein
MRTFLAICLLCASSSIARADAPPGFQTLTPAEIADGWILLFDGKTTFGWITEGDVRVENGTLILGEKGGSTRTSCTFPDGTVKQEINGKEETWLVKGGSAGQLEFRSENGMGMRLRNIRLKPTNMTPLFNGKDLTGWHAFQGPDQKSKFSVTPEGTLHIENGKGDLQTDGKWADFLMQIECRTNAPGLNSGVFFRCRPNEYQNGYEAQIQNSFGAEKEYTVERYDSKTNALIAKDKIKNASVDYGTGAIYRRIPARMQAAKDKEWCTMTILAEGKHLGVWVNGLMVTDWTDNRPLKDNARNGCKLEAGHISLQGHDPTTNLDFRNIRIIDLGKK